MRTKSIPLNNAMAVLDADFGQMYSMEWFQKFLNYQRTTSTSRIFRDCALLFICPLLCSLAIVALPVTEISEGLTGRNWFQIVQIGIGCLIYGFQISLRYKILVRGSSHHSPLCCIDCDRTLLRLPGALCIDRRSFGWHTSDDCSPLRFRKRKFRENPTVSARSRDQ